VKHAGRRLSALLLAALGLAACGGPHGHKSLENLPTGHPVVLISIDTLRSDHLPAYGYDHVETPAIDALRSDAVLYRRAYSQVPLTLPSHASILTGLLPPAHGVRDNAGYRLSPSVGPTLAELLHGAGYATGAAVSFVLRHQTGIARGFDHYDDHFSAGHEKTIGEIQRPGPETLEAILPWVRSVAGGPFFLFFHIYEPHTPRAPPEPFAARYGKTYDGEVAAADAVVGRLLDELKTLHAYDRSTIILLSDHGEGLGDHGEDEHGVLLYRESLQVPLIVKLPGAADAGAAVDRPVELVDVAPTVLALAGVDRPEAMTGVSLLKLAEGSPAAGDAPPRALYSETFNPRLRYGWSGLTSVIRGHYQYIEGADRELYDLAADPGETNNILRSHRKVYATLRDALHGFDSKLQQPFEEDSETRAALASLGYLGSVAPEDESPRPDPKAMLPALEGLRRATPTGPCRCSGRRPGGSPAPSTPGSSWGSPSTGWATRRRPWPTTRRPSTCRTAPRSWPSPWPAWPSNSAAWTTRPSSCGSRSARSRTTSSSACSRSGPSSPGGTSTRHSRPPRRR
jgi:arylsulfatase A-like enzyme